jgi:mRNA-degrading endonuclease RelE of RelBE toxin-antitoxin system
MSFKVLSNEAFEKQAKPLVKKYRSLKKELSDLITSLENQPERGTPIGKNCYKIRLAIESKQKGKSGGARVITFVRVTNEIVHLLSIYDKSEHENISESRVSELLKGLPNEE